MNFAKKVTNATVCQWNQIQSDTAAPYVGHQGLAASRREAAIERPVNGASKHGVIRAVPLLAFGILVAAHSVGHANSPSENSNENPEITEQDRSADVDSEVKMDEIVVLGTNIRGVAPTSAPLFQFEAEDIKNLGLATTEDFFRTLPQNAPTTTSSAFSGERHSPNLRGLGDGATLVLFNGRRLVSPGGINPDISFIPLNALERVDVLTDGASAVYGSDAIAGVVNFVINDQPNGFTASGYAGTVTDGDHDRWGATISGGSSWSTGSLVAVYDFTDQDNLVAADRDYSDVQDQFDLFPSVNRHSGVLTLRQELGDNTQVYFDALYASRDYANSSPLPNSSVSNFTNLDSNQLQLNSGAQVDLFESWRAEIGGVYSRYEGERLTIQDQLSDGSTVLFSSENTAPYYKIYGAFDGAVTTLPGGSMRASIGAGYSEEEYENFFARSDLGELLDRRLTRYTTYAFGELYVPIVSPEMDVPFIYDLEINASARFTEFSDLGNDVVPRYGVAWSPTKDFTLRTTYSESFRAVPLFRLIDNKVIAFLPFDFGTDNPDLVQGVNNVLFIASQSPPSGDIGPETSESISAGFDWSPSQIDGLQLSATYYKIDYVDQLGLPGPTNVLTALASPREFQNVLNFEPASELIRSILADSVVFADLIGVDITDPQAADLFDVIIDFSPVNLAASKVEGVDVSATYQRTFGEFDLTSSINAAYVVDLERQATPTSPLISELDNVLNLSNFRGQVSAGLRYRAFSSNLIVNYVGSMNDPESTFNPNIDDWTTLDLNLKYEFGSANNDSNVDGLAVDLSILNIFDADPPVVGSDLDPSFPLSEPLGYDPSNANPLGRYVQLRLTANW